jgi:hypothetical protein
MPKTARKTAKPARKAEIKPKVAAAAGAPRAASKLAKLIALLRRPEGATLEALAKATGWQAHSVRGAIAGALKKKRGLTVQSEKPSDGARVYRIT